MRRFIFLLLLPGFCTSITLAQVQKKKPGAAGTTHSGKKATEQTGTQLQFKDLLLITERREKRVALLKQKHFIHEEQQDQEAYPLNYPVTDVFRNSSREELCVAYDPAKDPESVVIFRTASLKRAQQLLADAQKNGLVATDSTESVIGNDQESFLIHKVRYSRQWSSTAPPPYPDAYIPSLTTSEAYTSAGRVYIFSFSEVRAYGVIVVEPGSIEPGAPGPVRTPDVESADNGPADTLFIDTGKPVFLFAEIGSGTGKRHQDSLDFFKKKVFFFGSFLRLTKAYPTDQYRYINLYRPTVVRYDNSTKEVLHFLPYKHASGFVYWGGKNTDPIVKHNEWQDALYVANNASGKNKLKPGYQSYLNDSVEVERILRYPLSGPSPRLLQYMNHIILSGVWHEALLPLPLLNLVHVRSITASNNEATIQYYFNQQGQLDSLTDGTEYGIAATKRILYKDGIPVAACFDKDTSRFSYAGDTLAIVTNGYILRYLLKDKVLLLIDNFKTGSNDYLRNNIRDYIHNQDHVPLEPSYEKDADGRLILTENSLYQSGYEKGYRNVQPEYIFRKGVLQRIELFKTGQHTVADKYYILIRNYN